MTQSIKTTLRNANTDLLDAQLKSALPLVCYGITADKIALYVILADSATQADIAQALAIAAAHDPSQNTPAQAAAITGRSDTAALLASADTALTQLAGKLTTFQATPTLGNAGPLLIEVTQDLIGVIKAMKYIAKQIPQ